FSEKQRRSVACAAACGGDPGRGIRVEHVVAVERRAPDPVAGRPVLEVGGKMMLIETGAQRHLVVFDDENGGDALHGGEVGAFVRRGRFRRPVAAHVSATRGSFLILKVSAMPVLTGTMSPTCEMGWSTPRRKEPTCK